MDRQLNASVYYLSTHVLYSLKIFWMILISILIVTIAADFIFMNDDTSVIAFNLSFPIYVFAGIVGQLTVKGYIPYLIKMGSTRKNLFAGIGIHFLSVAVFNALLANTIHSIVMYFYRLSGGEIVSNNTNNVFTFTGGEQSFSFNHLAYFVQDTWINRFVIDASISFFLLAIGFLLGLVFYRYGLIGGFSFIGVIVLISIMGMANGWLLDLFIAVFRNVDLLFFVQLFLVGVVLYLLSFLLLKRITVKT
ncbi:hypothetical protein ACLIBG_00090 [Virgibacillus sp. W0181]|uniref:hypothetical protein n=1 Tax=Virgibacillus sp. W0181 TaxID=3391581 RepID=UPI003F467903